MKPTLILVPGLLGHGQYLQNQVRFFKKHYRVIVLDFTPQETSVKQITAKIKKTLAENKLQKAILWAISFGGLPALEFTIQNPSRVSHLILGCTNYRFRFSKPLLKLLKIEPFLPFPLKKKIYRKIAGRTNFEKMLLDQMEVPDEEFKKHYQTHLARLFSAFQYHRRKELRQITCPTFIYSSRQDLLIPPSRSRKMHRLIPNSALEILPTKGHMPHATHSQLLNQKVLGFLQNN